jgi:hypothetical protein
MPFIPREECLKHFDMFEHSDCRVLLVEAQAGQGKTVFAEQCTRCTHTPHVWIACDEKDRDPVILFEKITRNLCSHLISIDELPLLKTLHQYGKGHEILYFGMVRLGEVLASQTSPLLLFFDDLHLLGASGQSLDLLKKLISKSPPAMRFVFLSRYPLSRKGAALVDPRICMRVDNAMLAFSRQETARLFSEILGNPLPTDQIRWLHELTQGWVTGLLLAGDQTSEALQEGIDAGNEKLRSYFLNLIQQYSISRDQLLLLSLLDEIPGGLVRSSLPAAMPGLEELFGKQMFVRLKRNSPREVYLLHHLFRDSLRSVAEDSLHRYTRAAWLKTAGEWYLNNGQPEDALRYFTRAADWQRISELLRDQGEWLIVNNRHHTLTEIMERIPKEVVGSDAWLSQFAGEVCFATQPHRCLPHFLRSKELFEASGEQLGELMAICQIITHHIAIDGRFGRQRKLVFRGESLFLGLQDQLSDISALRITHTLALGFLWIVGDAAKSDRYNKITKSLFERCDLAWQFPFSILNIVCERMFTGDLGECLTLMDTYFPVEKYRSASPTVRFTVELIFLHLLILRGEFKAYAQQRSILEQAYDCFYDYSYLGKLTLILDLDVCMTESKYTRMLELAEKNEADQWVVSVPHLLSQNQQFKALALANLGEHDQAWRTARQSLKLRARAGGPHFRQLNYILLGAALSLGPRKELGKKLLNKGIAGSRKVGEFYCRPTGLAYRAWLSWQENRSQEALKDLRDMLQIMQRHQNCHFPAWTPWLMHQLLALAVKEGIQADFARRLAREKLGLSISDDGQLLPLLLVGTLGQITFQDLSSGRTCTEADIRPKPLKLLKKLLYARNRTMRLDIMQEAMSQDEDTPVSRSTMDTLLSRLRSDLSKAAGIQGGRYIQVYDGAVRLHHCLFVQDLIHASAQNGLEAAKLGHAFSAILELSKVFSRIKGSLQRTADNAQPSLPKDILPMVSSSALALADIMRKTGKAEPALMLIEQMISYDPLNDFLQRDRYNLQIELGRPAQAMRGLRDYQAYLESEGFDPEEIEAIIDAIW